MLKPRVIRKLGDRAAGEIAGDIDLSPEGPFGLLDTLDAVLNRFDVNRIVTEKPAKKHKSKKSKSHTPIDDTTVPGIRVHESEEAVENVKYENLVEVPVSELKKTAGLVEENTRKFSTALLSHLVPLLISYASGTSYVRAALKEGLKLDIEFDAGLEEAISQIGYLNVISYFVKNSDMPEDTKAAYLNAVASNLGEKTVSRILEVNKQSDSRQRMEELQAYVRSRQGAPTTDTQEEAKPASKIAHGRTSRRR